MNSRAHCSSPASDRDGAQKARRIQTVKDGLSKEARSGVTMEKCSAVCDVLLFSPPSERPWPLRAKSSKQIEACEARAAWLTLLARRQGSGLQ